MNQIEYNKPFEFMWKGLKMQARIQTVEIDQVATELSILRLECAITPYIDNESNNVYNKSKGETMFCGSGLLDSVTYRPSVEKSTYKVEYKTFNFNEEDDMSIVKKYANKNRDKKLQKAIDNGLIREDGVLTSEGISLLSQILFENSETKKKFLDAVEELTESEE